MKDAIFRYLTGNGEFLLDENVPEIHREYVNARIEAVTVKQAPDGRAPIVLVVLRDEMDIIGDFLRHYRAGGIERFVVLDNNSTDGTFEYLRKQPDVDLYWTGADFTTLRKQAWIGLLIDIYGTDNWFIYADADEHIVFDGMENGRSFSDLAEVMDKTGIRRVRGGLVDMYSDQPILRARYRRGEALVENCPFFDGAGYSEYVLVPLIAREGGPRQRLFGCSSVEFRPQLTKYPMFRLDPGELFVNPHFLWPYDKNFASDCFLGILHFKFLPNFPKKMDRAIEEANYWKNSFEYQRYKSALSGRGDLTFMGGHTEFYQGPASLVRCNLISAISW